MDVARMINGSFETNGLIVFFTSPNTKMGQDTFQTRQLFPHPLQICVLQLTYNLLLYLQLL